LKTGEEVLRRLARDFFIRGAAHLGNTFAVSTTYAGSQRLPRWPGARYGESVSTNAIPATPWRRAQVKFLECRDAGERDIEAELDALKLDRDRR
jgi:hypothetical protein